MQLITGQILLPNTACSNADAGVTGGYDTAVNTLKFQTMTASSGQPVVTTVATISSTGIESTTFKAKSDRRLKENIKEFKTEKSILDLPVVEFDFKENKKHTIGCIAQDLQQICPEIVSTDDKGYLSIEEGKLVYLLLDEVKKLRKELDELKRG